jgi:hypothetical protein
MIFDRQTLFSDAQAVTATAASTNAIDLGPIANGMTRDIGKGTPIPLLIQVVEDFTNLTSLKIDIELDSTDTFTPDKTITVGTYPLASLVAGMQVPFQCVPDGVDLRYMRLKYTVTGTAPDAGKITAGIVMGRQTNG